MFDAIRRKQETANELRSRGFALSDKGKFDEAIEAHSKARKINEELEDIGAAAGDVTNTAIIYEHIKNMEKAEEFHLEAARMDESISYKQGLRIDYSNLTRFYSQKGDFEKALDYQEKLINVNLALGDLTGVAADYKDRGLILSHLGRIDEALEFHNKAKELNHLVGNVVGEANNLSDIATLFEKINSKDKALELFLEATTLDESIKNFDGLTTDYRNLARLYAEKGNLSATQEYQRKLSIVIAQTVELPELRLYVTDASGVKSGISIIKNQADTYDVGYEVPSPVRNKNRQQQVIINDRRLDEIKNRIELITERVNKSKQLRGSGLTNKSNELLEVHGKIFNELTSLGKALYAVTLPPQVKRTYRQILKTDAIEIGISENLVEYPWELMHNGEEFICLSNSTGRYVVVDNYDDLPNMRRIAQDKLRVLIIGDPCSDSDEKYAPPFEYLQDLPGARNEAKALAEYLSKIEGIEVNLFIGQEINTVRLLSELSSDYDFIHYTGHAIFASTDPQESGLVLHDGIVRAYEILQCIGSQQQPPALVFVNACESSREKDWRFEIQYANQVFGLASAFLRGGVNYLGSIWPLHDIPAIEIALDFYGNIFNGITFGEALRLARKNSYDKYGQNEITWASYTYYGDPTTIIKSTMQDSALMNKVVQRLVAQRLFGLDR